MRFIAIDWSGDRRGGAKKIWLAAAAGERLVRLEHGRDRGQVVAHLLAAAGRDPRLVVGLDFAFSLPTWFLDERGLSSAPELWALAAREGEGWLRACAPPFWGRPGKGRPALPEGLRRTDRQAPATAGIRPKSAFQIGGTGAIGTGSLRGMPTLRRLQAAGFAIWPFDPPGWPRVVEIYPRLLTGAVNKSSAAARAAYLAARYPDLDPAPRERAIAGEDAFDAAVSALVMAAHRDDLVTLPAATDRQLLLEGLIWHPGWRAGAPPG